ncbi:catalase [Brachybacterium phenoliresistens]|uniref:catalase n=1 Tax=Brachybacterium phenoliresistens TaxID=396014 RepID=UPI0031E0D85D
MADDAHDSSSPTPRDAAPPAAAQPDEAQPAGYRVPPLSQEGRTLTTSQGLRLRDTDHSLRAGARGPSLLQDHHLREKITHFDHERIPERVVHARGAAAHGHFESYGTAASRTVADFLAPGRVTEVFTRFSTVVGSRGSADTVRDTRGFATRFYTREGNYDLVANNIPVFFIQDGIKFPDIIHAAKPHPDREIPQAQSAHDTFWDFVSLHTEAQHHAIWQMSDRAVPRSYRMMEGFGIHTFRLTDAEGGTCLVKLHWKPLLGVHSLTWEEAQMLGGADPDFHRRDLADAIDAGHFPRWELGMQVLPDSAEEMFEGIDLLDPTKLIPEELAPVQPVGLLTLDRNPTNYFAETEQVAFHPGNLAPGIDVTDDPLLQARLFSYIDTQITRLGGPNFSQLPINRPHAPVDDMLRDGFGQQAVHEGIAPYSPNSLDGGCPMTAGADPSAFLDVPAPVAGSVRERRAPASFEDHFSQARLFWRSLTALERDHVVAAYSFELGRCREVAVRERQVQCLARIDAELCRRVAAALGLPAPEAEEPPAEDMPPSAALSQLGGRWPVDGRVVGVVVDPDVLPRDLEATLAELETARLRPLIIAPQGGEVVGRPVDRTFATAQTFELDGILLAGAPAAAVDARPTVDARAGTPVTGAAAVVDGAGRAVASAVDPRVIALVQGCWRHAKPIAAWQDGEQVVEDSGVAGRLAGLDPSGAGSGAAAGVVIAADGLAAAEALRDLLAEHRVWTRFEPAAS